MPHRLPQANSANLPELREIMSLQPGAEKLCDIAMKDIIIEAGAADNIIETVKGLTEGTKVLMVTGPSLIVDIHGNDVKKKLYAKLQEAFTVEWLVIDEPGGHVHCTPENAAHIMERLGEFDILIGCGGGTICDMCKYAVHNSGLEKLPPLIVVETALSVNAFSDDASVMLLSGVKRTLHSRYPDVLVIDLDIVSAAPAEMNVSGYGDLIATWTAPVDWYLSSTMGMGGNFHVAPSDMIRTQCEQLLENSAKLAANDPQVIADLANVLTLSGLSMGLAGESAPASGSEHVMSHLVDMASGVRQTGICYHGTQVAVSGLISEIVWDYLVNEFDPKSVDVEKCYPTHEEMEPKVREAFGWLDTTGSAANECWNDYQKKLTKWHANKENFVKFLENFEEFKATVKPWLKKPEYVAECMHKANAPTRYSTLNYPVDAKTATWAITNCHLMRNRFSVIDLLHFAGVWNDEFVQKVIARAEAMDAGL